MAIESTGPYWKPVFNVLDGTVVAILANAQQVKARKGPQDGFPRQCWLAHLLRHAMIRPSFIPPRAIRELRELTRRRKQLMNAEPPSGIDCAQLIPTEFPADVFDQRWNFIRFECKLAGHPDAIIQTRKSYWSGVPQ